MNAPLRPFIGGAVRVAEVGLALSLICSHSFADTIATQTHRPVHLPSSASHGIEWQLRKQNVGKMVAPWGNNGGIESAFNGLIPDECDLPWHHGVEYPKGSNHRWNGFTLWLGGVRDGDTLVSTFREDITVQSGVSGYWTYEVLPAPAPEGLFVERTTRERLSRGAMCSELRLEGQAISEHDLISISTDTVTDPSLTGINPFDGRTHKPLGLKITCRRYAWSYDYAEDFIIIEYKLELAGVPERAGTREPESVDGLVIGVCVETGLATYIGSGAYPYRDPTSILGRLGSAPLRERPGIEEPFNLVWVGNEDGSPLNGAFDYASVTEVYGVRVLKPGPDEARFSFNWWSNSGLVTGWGPRLLGSRVQFVMPGNMGRPETDRGKYQFMTNGELDYPQVEAAISRSGWYPPPPDGSSIASSEGTFSECLLSFGPFSLDPGDSVTFALALVAGEGFHTNPFHFAQTFDPYHPDTYMAGLDFSDLIQNARWAGWMYDSPGYDTDGDGQKGRFLVDGLDTLYYQGDGIPDFKGPPPPPAPYLTSTTGRGEIFLRWNGYRAETTLDPFFNRRDFEGYRVYMSRTGNPGDWSLVAQRDLVNYARYTWSEARQRWLLQDAPFSRDSLKSMYDSLCLMQYGYPFEPDSFTSSTMDKALLDIQFDPRYPERVDSLYRYFGPFGANVSPKDSELDAAQAMGLDVFNVIRKVYPDSGESAIATRPDGTAFAPFYEYEIALRDLQVAEPIVLAVTSFDHGDPKSNFPPLETTPETNARTVWPLLSAEIVKSERPEPGVYPNPYRLLDDYYGSNWENRQGLEPDRERARQVTFYNMPDSCTLSIWSLDGDLVRKIKHYADPGASEATVVRWDLITRNTQAVKSGIYIWSVESRFGTDVGKLVIIK